MSNDTTEFVDDRARQDSLIKQPARADPDTRLDRGASEEFTDDRADLEESDTGDQASLTIDTVGDGQQDLSGNTAGEPPEWSDSR